MKKLRNRKPAWLLTVASAYALVPGCGDDGAEEPDTGYQVDAGLVATPPGLFMSPPDAGPGIDAGITVKPPDAGPPKDAGGMVTPPDAAVDASVSPRDAAVDASSKVFLSGIVVVPP